MNDTHWLTDSRPELPDAAFWRLALREAWPTSDKPDGLFGVLRGLRAYGARIERMSSGKLAGKVALLRGEIDEATYAEWRRRYLVPHGPLVTRLLDAISNQALAGRVGG